MAGLGVQVAIFHDDKILLIKREDFEVWGMPGGEIDAGETAVQAAIREAKEETGYDVRLKRMVGMYMLPQLVDSFANEHIVLFAASVIGGTLLTSTSETLGARFFSPDNLPKNIMWHHVSRIHDAFVGASGIVRTQIVESHLLTVSRAELYRLRDESDLSPVDFFEQVVFPRGTERNELEE